MEEENGTIIINQKDYTKDMIKRFDIKSCNRTYKLGKRLKLTLYQPNVSLLDKKDKMRY